MPEFGGIEFEFDLDDDDMTITQEVVRVVKYHGCTCAVKVYVIKPWPDVVGLTLRHENTCDGLQRVKAEGN